jgi:hypothetical protein
MAKTKVQQSDAEIIEEWQKYYNDLGIEVDLANAGIRIPAWQKGFDWTILVAPGLGPQRIYEAVTAALPRVWVWTTKESLGLVGKNLDKVIFSARSGKEGTYAVRIRNVAEATRDLCMSAFEARLEGIRGISFEERYLADYCYFRRTGKTLDSRDNITICSGSRHKTIPEIVPYVYNHNGYVFFGWVLETDSNEDTGIRRVLV